jgi:hypothetical protein
MGLDLRELIDKQAAVSPLPMIWIRSVFPFPP